MAFDSHPLAQNNFGTFNYIRNGNFDRLDAYSAQVAGPQNWNAYKDAAATTPSDGTGGSPTVINNAIIGSGQLRGLKSMSITKTGNAQGEGYSTDFTIDTADKGIPLTISFDFSSGSAYTAGDLAVFVYDITNSTLITPSVSSLSNGSGLFQATFLATTSTSYRLILHCAASNATTTNWSMIVDSVRVSNQTPIIAAAIGDWVLTSVIAIEAGDLTNTPRSLGSTGSTTIYMRREGDSVRIRGSVDSSGTGRYSSGVGVAITMPAGLVIDATKCNGQYPQGNMNFKLITAGPTFEYGNVQARADTNQINFLETDGFGYQDLFWSRLAAPTTSGELVFEILAPIVGLSSNIQLANNQTEYAFNTEPITAAGATASNSAYFGHGPEGTPILAINSTTASAATRFQVQFNTPIQPTDVLSIEFRDTADSANKWLPLIGGRIENTTYANTAIYGIDLETIAGSTDKVLVEFGNAGRTSNPSTYGGLNASGWADLTTWNWRVRKSSGPNAVQLSGAIVGVSNGTDAQTGYIGEYKEAKVLTYTNFPTPSGTWGDLGSIVLTPGDWDISAIINTAINGATVTGIAVGIGTALGTSTTGLIEGNNYINIAVPVPTEGSGSSIASYRVNITTTTTYYFKVNASYTVATPQYVGRISARRMR